MCPREGARGALAVLAAFVLAALVTIGGAVAPAGASPVARAAARDVPPPPVPKAYVLIDADTGRVVASQQAHQPMLPASTIKLFTALVAVERLPAGDLLPISALAESMPARKMNVKAGQQWAFIDLLHAMLMVSANDAAVAIAERVGGGSLEGWADIAKQTAERLGLSDSPAIRDPAGLDDAQFAYGGGSMISARDLAIVARAVLNRPDLMAIVQTPHYEFIGGDTLGHKLNNQDLFLSLYPGATGLKTGTTDRAGRTFVGSATRDGRTMLTVVFDAVDPLRSAELLLDQGFATPAAAEPVADALPPVVLDAALTPAPAPADNEAAAGSTGATTGHSLAGSDTVWINSPPIAATVLVVGLVLLVFVRRAMLEHFEQQRQYNT